MSNRPRFRFGLKWLLLATTLVAVGLWLIPEIVLELKWRGPRQRLATWARQVDRTDYNHITSEQVGGSLFVISTKPAYCVDTATGLSVVHMSFPEQEEFDSPEASPHGSDAGFFIIPQCVWVETADEVVKIWKRTVPSDWRRYESIDPRLKSSTP